MLVTGAGGSIGSELCRQIARFGPAELLMLDRDESALHALMLSLYGRADLESDSVILANIREADRIHAIMRERRPDVVFHAAALKHVNILENHPSEAVSTNILGTLNVLEAAADIEVERFVNISTDKAADPINVLGYTKRVAEGLTAAFANDPYGIYLSVRFGNVLGTSGSVLTTFESQVSERRANHRHAPGGDPVLHDRERGGPAPHPGRCHRQERRGARAGHGRPCPHLRRRPSNRRAGRRANRDGVHRAQARREAPRGPLRDG